MNCLICGNPFYSAPTWRKLFLYEVDASTCNRCYSKFQKADTAVDFLDFKGTIYEEAVDSVTALYAYNEAMKSYLHQYKFLQDVALATVFATDLSQLFENKEGIVVPIPMHLEKLQIRTFAQVDELLNSASIPFKHLLVKTATSEQGKKSKKERLKATPLFEVIGKVEEKTYILFDDIYTTGTTIHHAAKVLKDAGAKKVEAITLIKG
ncbi:ComF family protein [Psychrobacillus vulpis]|uniref:ComF family protein n=1 Tax=Psychrobacillus vulpis TaxID=2325572 RepID=A0A544TJ06_9BACI|nr:ComF family protein [Psychrobacillus vulpis]TQR17368.1 ComF family protein [Psychrobacillus vulpis]